MKWSFSKSQIIGTLAILLFGWALPNAQVQGQETYPNRPITLLLGYSAGGPTDLTARALGDAAGKILGQPIVVINKPGGTSSVALSVLMAEKPNGYSIAVMPSGGILASLLRKVPYDPVKDFTPVIQYGGYQDGLVVGADSPWKTFQEFIEYAKNNPGKIQYSTGGAGIPEHLVMERLAIRHGIKWLLLPYEGDVPAATALLGGHVNAFAGSAGGWKAQVDAGKFRLLATFHEKRMESFPEAPTLVELGYNIVAASLISIVGPKGMPEPVLAKLHDAFKRSMADSNFTNSMERLGCLVIYRGPQELKEYVQRMVHEEGELIHKLGLRK